MAAIHTQGRLERRCNPRRIDPALARGILGTAEISPSNTTLHLNVCSSLLRIFGLGFGLAVVIGGVVGSGIMRNPRVVASGFPHPVWILLAWLGGGIFVAIDAMPTVELGSAIPLAGGPYSIITRAIGPKSGFLIGWACCPD